MRSTHCRLKVCAGGPERYRMLHKRNVRTLRSAERSAAVKTPRAAQARGRSACGLTMIELLLTLTVLSIVGMIAVPALSRRSERAEVEITLQSMAAVRTVVLKDYRGDMFESLPFP